MEPAELPLKTAALLGGGVLLANFLFGRREQPTVPPAALVTDRPGGTEVKPTADLSEDTEVKPTTDLSEDSEFKRTTDQPGDTEVEPPTDHPEDSEVKSVTDQPYDTDVKPPTDHLEDSEVKSVTDQPEGTEVKSAIDQSEDTEVKPTTEQPEDTDVKQPTDHPEDSEVKLVTDQPDPPADQKGVKKQMPDVIPREGDWAETVPKEEGPPDGLVLGGSTIAGVHFQERNDDMELAGEKVIGRISIRRNAVRRSSRAALKEKAPRLTRRGGSTSDEENHMAAQLDNVTLSSQSSAQEFECSVKRTLKIPPSSQQNASLALGATLDVQLGREYIEDDLVDDSVVFDDTGTPKTVEDMVFAKRPTWREEAEILTNIEGNFTLVGLDSGDDQTADEVEKAKSKKSRALETLKTVAKVTQGATVGAVKGAISNGVVGALVGAVKGGASSAMKSKENENENSQQDTVTKAATKEMVTTESYVKDGITYTRQTSITCSITESASTDRAAARKTKSLSALPAPKF